MGLISLILALLHAWGWLPPVPFAETRWDEGSQLSPAPLCHDGKPLGGAGGSDTGEVRPCHASDSPWCFLHAVTSVMGQKLLSSAHTSTETFVLQACSAHLALSHHHLRTSSLQPPKK